MAFSIRIFKMLIQIISNENKSFNVEMFSAGILEFSLVEPIYQSFAEGFSDGSNTFV